MALTLGALRVTDPMTRTGASSARRRTFGGLIFGAGVLGACALGCTPDLNSLVSDQGAGAANDAETTLDSSAGGALGMGDGSDDRVSTGGAAGEAGESSGSAGIFDAMAAGAGGILASDANMAAGGSDKGDATADGAPMRDDAADVINDVRNEPAVRPARETGCFGGGNALQSNGTGYLRLPRPVQDDFTLEAWIRLASSLSGPYFFNGSRIFWADSSVGGANDFSVVVLSDHLTLGITDSAVKGLSNVVTNDWVHIAITREKSSGRVNLFVNGFLDGSQVTGNTASLNASPTMSIAGSDETHQGIDGSIDEVRVWNIVRAPLDILNNMGKTLAGDEPGLIAYFRLDETGGLKAFDSSNAGNLADVVGAPTWVASDAPLCASPRVKDASARDAVGE